MSIFILHCITTSVKLIHTVALEEIDMQPYLTRILRINKRRQSIINSPLWGDVSRIESSRVESDRPSVQSGGAFAEDSKALN